MVVADPLLDPRTKTTTCTLPSSFRELLKVAGCSRWTGSGLQSSILQHQLADLVLFFLLHGNQESTTFLVSSFKVLGKFFWSEQREIHMITHGERFQAADVFLKLRLDSSSLQEDTSSQWRRHPLHAEQLSKDCMSVMMHSTIPASLPAMDAASGSIWRPVLHSTFSKTSTKHLSRYPSFIRRVCFWLASCFLADCCLDNIWATVIVRNMPACKLQLYAVWLPG